MESLRQIGAGFLLAVLSISFVLGGFMLSMAEGGVANIQPSTALPTFVIETRLATVPAAISTQALPGAESETQTATLQASSTPPPTSAFCAPPAGWVAIVVQTYDTLELLAQTYQISSTAIKDGNCLVSDQLLGGSYLYVPLRPTATFVPCGAPYGWVRYSVVPGDTLYNIGVRYAVTVSQLQIANCLGSSAYIQAGRLIWVPNVITATPFGTATAIWTVTDIPTILPTATATTEVYSTDTPVPPTVEPTVTPEPTITPEPSLTSESLAPPLTPGG